jgi:hypothetical protein
MTHKAKILAIALAIGVATLPTITPTLGATKVTVTAPADPNEPGRRLVWNALVAFSTPIFFVLQPWLWFQPPPAAAKKS